MNREETAKLIFTVKAVYPSHYARYTAQDFENLIAAWCAVLEDYTYAQASTGLKIFLSSETKGFPPTPGQIIDCIHKTMPKAELEMSGLEAWALVRKAISKALYYADEEYNKLPDVVKKAIGSPENIKQLAMMDIDEVETVEQSHFIRAYEALKVQKKDEVKIPREIRELIERNIARGAITLSDDYETRYIGRAGL